MRCAALAIGLLGIAACSPASDVAPAQTSRRVLSQEEAKTVFANLPPLFFAGHEPEGGFDLANDLIVVEAGTINAKTGDSVRYSVCNEYTDDMSIKALDESTLVRVRLGAAAVRVSGGVPFLVSYTITDIAQAGVVTGWHIAHEHVSLHPNDAPATPRSCTPHPVTVVQPNR
jgi:hypothetical protein